jgi:hypothetical protein
MRGPRLFGDEPYDERGGSRKTAIQQEKRLAKRVNGKAVRGSGSSVYSKGDVHSDSFLVEAKHTNARSIRLTDEWLAKITKEAIAVGKNPALEFELLGSEDPMLEKSWIAVPMSVWTRIIDGN